MTFSRLPKRLLILFAISPNFMFSLMRGNQKCFELNHHFFSITENIADQKLTNKTFNVGVVLYQFSLKICRANFTLDS